MILTKLRKISSTLTSILYHNGGKALTQSKTFKILISKAFTICDTNSDGKIDEVELYAGVLLVHLNLAKYAGPAACYPPSRSVCHDVFMKADIDTNGTIDRQEFQYIVGILVMQIMLRMLVYYIVLILFVPILASHVVKLIHSEKGTYAELLTYQIVSISLFFIAIPLLWDYIDSCSSRPISYNDAINGNIDDVSVDNGEELVSLEPLQLPSRRRRKQQLDA